MKKESTCLRDTRWWFYRLMLVSIILLSAVSVSTAQQNSKKININLKNASLTEVLEQMKQQSGLSFMYSSDDMRTIPRKDYLIKDLSLTAALEQSLSKTGLEYEFTNNVIIIRKSVAAVQPAARLGTVSIKGVVKSEKGDILIGVTVVAKGTTFGNATDKDGKFEVKVPDANGVVLVFSCVGMQTKEVAYKGESLMLVTLSQVDSELQDVVVTGIFTRKAESYTGAITTIKKEDLQKVGNHNVLQSLQIIEPSFAVMENNDFGSDPNKVPDIQMRGSSNFSDMKDKYQTNPNQPLFIVDGFEQSIAKVMDMDMNRIESVTLLKDATAKALYGSKGANGVVVIETIPPEPGRLKVSYTGNLNIQVPDMSSYNLATASEKLEIERRAGIYGNPDVIVPGGNPATQYNYLQKYNEYYAEVLRGVNTYLLSAPLQVGVGQKHSLFFEGGDQVIRYSINFAYNNIEGVMKGSNREVISGGFNFQYRYKKFLFRDQMEVTFNKSNESPYGVFSEYARLNPYWRAYNEDGSVREVLGTYTIANSQGFHSIYNPLINSTLNTKNAASYTDITNNFYAEWDAFKGMKIKGRFGLVSNTNGSEIFLPRDHTSFRDITPESDQYFSRGRYTMGNGKNFNYNADLSANYSITIRKHVLFANAQWSVGERKTQMVYFQAQGFANNKMDYVTYAKEYATGAPYGSESVVREASGLASINYSFDNRFLLDASFRTNGSSLYGADKRWGGFWSTGIGWNIHQERFMKWDFLEKLKLRASTGYSGAQNFNSYQAMATYKYYNETYDNIVGAYMLGLANRDLQWQKTQDNNIGVDLSMFKMIDITFDYYVKNTKNLLTPVALPPSVGFTDYTENLGETRNKGFEGKINMRLIKNVERKTYFSVFATVMHNKNKVTKISDALDVINETRDNEKNSASSNPNHETGKGVTKPSTRYAEGQSMSAIWAVRSLGINPYNGNEVFLSADGKMVYQWNPKDQVVVGDGLPKVSGTFGFNFEFHGFSVNTSFFYRIGGQYYNGTLVNKIENADLQYNVDRRMYTDRWTTPGVPAKYKAFNSTEPFTRPSTRFVQDLNELTMTSLNVGYDFRYLNFMKKGFIERLKVQFYANDLFRISTVKAERGIEYPYARSYSFSVQATF